MFFCFLPALSFLPLVCGRDIVVLHRQTIAVLSVVNPIFFFSPDLDPDPTLT
jgi:hypothetical protein